MSDRRHAPPPAPPGEAVRLGLTLAHARLGARATALIGLLGATLVVTSATIERRVGSAGAVDRVLVATFHLVVPLVAFAVSVAVTERRGLQEAVWPVARHGVARRDVALGVIAAAALGSALLCAALAVLAVLAAHGPGNPPAAGDAFTSAWIGALTAAAYTGWFALGATFGKRGGGRLGVLVVDYALGGGLGLFGAILPRAHAASLLGGAAPLGMAQAGSSATLAASALLLAVVAALRCRE